MHALVVAKGIAEKLAAEFMAAAKGEGAAVKREGRYAQNGRCKPRICSLPVYNLGE